MSQRKVRELTLQMLFQREMAGQSAEEAERLFWSARPAPEQIRTRVRALFYAAVEGAEEIDRRIEEAATHWRLDRLASVDRNVLRLAIAEMMHFDTPPAVVIDEAIEIARRFGSERSPEFVNAILDRVHSSLEEKRA